MFPLLWIVNYIGVSLCSLMRSAGTSLVASVNSVNSVMGEKEDNALAFFITSDGSTKTQQYKMRYIQKYRRKIKRKTIKSKLEYASKASKAYNLEYAGQFKSIEDRNEDVGRQRNDETVGDPDHPVLGAVEDDLGRRS